MSIAQRGAGPAAGMPPGPPMPSNPAERYPHPEATWRHRPSKTVEEGFSLIADGGGGCEDGVDRGRRMGHHRYVRSRGFGDRRARPLRHAALCGRGYDAVLSSDHGPTRYGPPGGRLRRRGVRAERDRTLTRGDQPPVRLGEGLPEGIVDGRWL